MTTTTLAGTLADKINDLVHAKLAEAAGFPDAIASWKCSSGHSFDTWLTSGFEDSVRYMHDSDGQHRLTFGNHEKPAYEMAIDDSGAVQINFAGEEADCPDPYEQLELASSLSVCTNELVPYGWVAEGAIITAILWMSDMGQSDIDGIRLNDIGLDCMVLEGSQLPTELVMAENDGIAWIHKVWQHIKDGKLIRLSDQIHSLEGELWAESDGTSPRGWLKLEGADNYDGPKIIGGTRYMFWHPREEHPNQLFNDGKWPNEPYKNHTKTWFR